MKKTSESELLDLIDPDGKPTGEMKPRDAVHRDGDLHATVHIWVLDGDHRLLLQKRAPHKLAHPGMWDISCAGHIPAGETSRYAAVKELHEELGLRIAANALLYAGSATTRYTHSRDDRIWTDHERHDIYVLRLEDPRIAEIRFIDGEVTAIAWQSLNKFFQRIHGGDPTLVQHPEAYRLMASYFARTI